MNECGICQLPVDWSKTVGEIDIRQWFAGRATAWKSFICENCLININYAISEMRPKTYE
jgi:hypothetical protein